MRASGAADLDGRDEVDVQGAQPVGAAGVGAVVEVGAGEVDQPVQAVDGHRGDGGGHGVVVGDVGRVERDALAELVEQRLDALGVDVGDRDG